MERLWWEWLATSAGGGEAHALGGGRGLPGPGPGPAMERYRPYAVTVPDHLGTGFHDIWCLRPTAMNYGLRLRIEVVDASTTPDGDAVEVRRR